MPISILCDRAPALEVFALITPRFVLTTLPRATSEYPSSRLERKRRYTDHMYG
jgi:hypothetical protein